jgi:metal-responsive CopG/Arc/MetJ family transcriptional regulator
MDTPTKVITAHLPLPLAERVDEMAARLQRSRGWIMKQALEAWMDQNESANGKQMGFAEAQTNFDYAAKANAARAAETLKTLRATTTLGDISWQELRDAGRR